MSTQRVVSTWWEVKWDTPKSFGTQGSRAFARDWVFRGDSQAQFGALFTGWDFANVDYLNPLHAITLRMRHALANTPAQAGHPNLPDVTEDPASTETKGWRLHTVPKSPAVNYFKYIDTDPRVWGGVKLNKSFDLDAGVVVYVLRSNPSSYTIANGEWVSVTPEQGLLQPYVSIHLPDITKDGVTYRYAIYFPTVIDKDEYEFRQPFIRRGVVGSEWSVSNWETVSRYAGSDFSDYLSRANYASEAVEEAIIIRVLEGVLMINTGRIGQWWCHEDDILTTAPVGQMRFYAQAHSACFLACQGYISPLTGTITRRAEKMPSVPSGCSLANWDTTIRCTPDLTVGGRDGATVQPIEAHDGSQITSLGATLTAGNSLRTPILYMINERFAPDFATEVASDHSVRATRVEIRRRRADNGSVRGSTCRIVLDPAQDAPDFKGNEVVTVRVFEKTATLNEGTGEWSVDAEPRSYLVFTGRVVSPEVEVNDRATVGKWRANEVEVQDESFRISKKIARRRLGTISGEKFKDVVVRVAEAFSIPRAKVKINGVLVSSVTDDTVLYEKENEGAGKGDTNRNFAYTDNGLAVFDKIAALRGDWTWSVEVDGCINFHQKPAPDEEPDFTLRRAPSSPDDYVRALKYHRNNHEYVNTIYAITREERKSREDIGDDGAVETYCRDDGSIEDPTDPHYTGDEWEDVIVLQDKEDAALELERKAEEVEQNAEIVTFEIQGRELFAGQFAKSLVSDFPLPTGSLLLLGDEVRTLEANADEQKHSLQFIGLLYERGDGTEPAE